MLSQKQQRDIAVAGLLALGLFLLAALIPVSVLGPRGVEWFPSGNVMGVVGESVRRALTALVGIAAFFVPGSPPSRWARGKRLDFCKVGDAPLDSYGGPAVDRAHRPWDPRPGQGNGGPMG